MRIYTDPTTNIAEPQTNRRRVRRISFKATSVVTETGRSGGVVAQTTELSRLGCFVQTLRPYPQRTRVYIERTRAGTTFAASGVVAHVTGDGMGIVFSMVESENYEILSKWLSRIPRSSDRYSFGATAEVKDLGSPNEQVLVTRDLSAGGCFVKTGFPLPKGSRVQVRIMHLGTEFTAVGRVIDNVSCLGMGVEFIEMALRDRSILEKWLANEKGA